MKIGIVGYGNVGKGVEQAIALNPDAELSRADAMIMLCNYLK